MGLYSEVINHCPMLGEGFQGVLQTKDLTSLMDYFWLAPDGCLYQVREPPDDESRGRISPFRVSGTLTLVSSKGTEALTYFKCGELNAVLCAGPIFSCRNWCYD